MILFHRTAKGRFLCWVTVCLPCLLVTACGGGGSPPGSTPADTLSPTIAVVTTKSSLIAGDTASLTFTLSEPSTNFIVSDVSVVGGILSGFTGNGTSYTATFTPTANSTTSGVVNVASGVFTDAAGNANNDGSDANNTVTFAVDTVIPTIAATSNKSNLIIGETAPLTFTLSEPSSNFVSSDVTVTGGTLANFAGSGVTYTATFTLTASGATNETVSVASGVFTDAAGNANNDGADANNTVTFTRTTVTPAETWVQSASTTGLNMQSAWYRNRITYAGGANGVYRSDDEGSTFRPSNSGNDAVGPTRAFADDANYIYSATSQGVYRSADQGANWTARTTGLAELRTSGLLKVGTRLYVVGPNGVFRSDNQGDNWVSAGLVGTDVRCIAALGDTLYVGTVNAGVFKSADFGATWTAINTGLSATTFRAIESKGTTLFLGGEIGSGVFRSLNGGASWTQLGGGLASSAYRGFASNDQLIIAGSFTVGIFYSRNNGDTWTSLNTGLTDLSVFDLAITDTAVVAATNTSGVFRIALSAFK